MHLALKLRLVTEQTKLQFPLGIQPLLNQVNLLKSIRDLTLQIELETIVQIRKDLFKSLFKTLQQLVVATDVKDN